LKVPYAPRPDCMLLLRPFLARKFFFLFWFYHPPLLTPCFLSRQLSVRQRRAPYFFSSFPLALCPYPCVGPAKVFQRSALCLFAAARAKRVLLFFIFFLVVCRRYGEFLFQHQLFFSSGCSPLPFPAFCSERLQNFPLFTTPDGIFLRLILLIVPFPPLRPLDRSRLYFFSFFFSVRSHTHPSQVVPPMRPCNSFPLFLRSCLPLKVWQQRSLRAVALFGELRLCFWLGCSPSFFFLPVHRGSCSLLAVPARSQAFSTLPPRLVETLSFSTFGCRCKDQPTGPRLVDFVALLCHGSPEENFDFFHLPFFCRASPPLPPHRNELNLSTDGRTAPCAASTCSLKLFPGWQVSPCFSVFYSFVRMIFLPVFFLSECVVLWSLRQSLHTLGTPDDLFFRHLIWPSKVTLMDQQPFVLFYWTARRPSAKPGTYFQTYLSLSPRSHLSQFFSLCDLPPPPPTLPSSPGTRLE